MPLSSETRVRVVLIAAVLLVGISVYAFRVQDLQDWAPTALPRDYRDVAMGTRLELGMSSAGRPVVLHFMNPECPCSRFNVEHLAALKREYQERVRFVVVLPEGEPDVVARYEALGLGIEAVVDRGGKLAEKTGAYATPQGVVVDREGRMVFRGNYNLARYCREKDSEFVRIALDAVVRGVAVPMMPEAATRGYGCPLRRGDRKRS